MKQDYIFRKIDYHGDNISRVNKVYDKIRELLNQGVLEYKIRQLKSVDDSLLNTSREESWNEALDSETEAHERLKAYAATYIRDSGKEPVFEQPCWFGVADIGTADQTVFAEAGKIDINKLLKAFGYAADHQYFGEKHDMYGMADRLLILPYSINANSSTARAIDLMRK